MPQGPVARTVHLTAAQVAERLQVSVEYLYRELLGHADGIPGLKIGRGPRARWRIKLTDLEAWEERQRVCYDSLPTRGVDV